MCSSASERVQTGVLGFASNRSGPAWGQTRLGAARGFNNAATNRQARVLTMPRLSRTRQFLRWGSYDLLLHASLIRSRSQLSHPAWQAVFKSGTIPASNLSWNAPLTQTAGCRIGISGRWCRPSLEICRRPGLFERRSHVHPGRCRSSDHDWDEMRSASWQKTESCRN